MMMLMHMRDQLEEACLRLRINTYRRFIKNEQIWTVNERPGQKVRCC